MVDQEIRRLRRRGSDRCSLFLDLRAWRHFLRGSWLALQLVLRLSLRSEAGMGSPQQVREPGHSKWTARNANVFLADVDTQYILIL
jgi:hypothetical protein